MRIPSSRARRCVAAAVPLAAFLSFASPAAAEVSTGPGGQGVTAGKSALIGTYDYAETFTGTDNGGTNPFRAYAPAFQPLSAYNVENTFGRGTVTIQSASRNGDGGEFSFAADAPNPTTAGNPPRPGLVDGVPTYPGSSGAGSATGITQTGGSVDYGVAYGFRPAYVVQADVVTTTDRVDVTSAPLPGSIFQANSLSVFFRGTTGAVSLYNGTTDTVVPGIDTGLRTAGVWHNFAVKFDQPNGRVELLVDEVSKGTINLQTFAGGLYLNYSNAAVGVGTGLGGGQNRSWTDNFQVGEPAVAVPEPAAAVVAPLAVAGGALLRRRQR